MATKRLHDLPIKKDRIAQNRDDPKGGEGPWCNLVSTRAAEQVTLNGLQWQNDYNGPIVNYELPYTEGRTPVKPQGNRARSPFDIGGHNIINGGKEGQSGLRRLYGGNRSGE